MRKRRKRGRPELGKNHLHWCEHCGVPVLDGVCGTCSGATRRMALTPPYDIRPAFESDIRRINECTQRQFGCEILGVHEPVVLSKVPYVDRMDEVIARGCVLGSIRFELHGMRWMFLPRLEAAAIMEPTRGAVEVDRGAADAIRSGGSVLAAGVLSVSPEVRTGDEVIVYCGEEPIACGRARMNAEHMRGGRGVAVKVRWRRGGVPLEPVHFGSERELREALLRANSHVVSAFREEAVAFIQEMVEHSTLPLTVSYSGGKDSLAVLLLCLEVVDKVDVLFANTGLEFPETLENVHEVVNSHGLRLVESNAEDAFWQSLPTFGLPSVDMRWCCKVCKLGPLATLIAEHYPEGCLSFIGQRRYESEVRARSGRVWKNPWVVNQVGASPIQHWTAMHVWLYLFSKDAPYNPLYEMGYDRIGCWMCPSSSMADFYSLKHTHPQLSRRWEETLLEYAEAHGLSDEWATLGLWRWSEPPQELAQLAHDLGIETRPTPSSTTLEFSMTSGGRTCTGGISAEGRFSSGLDIAMLAKSGQLRPLGKVVCTNGAVIVHGKEATVHVYTSGAVVARAKDERDAKRALRLAEKLIRRAHTCTGCGVCVPYCPVGAISIEKKAMTSEECTSCGRCLVACPALRYDPLHISEV